MIEAEWTTDEMAIMKLAETYTKNPFPYRDGEFLKLIHKLNEFSQALREEESSSKVRQHRQQPY